MNKLQLLECLWTLEPTGEKGFEGLIKRLLEALLNKEFVLAKSGYQQGSDMVSHASFPKIAVECKRYGVAVLNDRELLGEMIESQLSNPNLDLWILATTQKVDSTLLTKLQSAAFNQAIGLVILDEDKDNIEPGWLIALCCEFQSITKEFISEDKLIDNFNKYAENIRIQKDHVSRINHIRKEIDREISGLDHEQICDFLLDRFNSPERMNFIKQDIHPGNAIIRKNLNDALSKWLNDGCKETVLIIGEEGLGKTWGLAKWIYELVSKKTVPVLFATSCDVADMTEPDEVLISLLQRYAPQNSFKSWDFWKRKISYWHETKKSRVIVIIDGINEWVEPRKAGVLLKRWDEYGLNKFAHLVITCREYHWREILSLNIEKSNKIIVNELDDSELKLMLDSYKLSIEDLPQNIHNLIRRPRYFHLAINLREELKGFRNVTPAHLIYSDLENKYKQNLITGDSLGLRDHRDFESLIKKVIEDSPQSKVPVLNPNISRDKLRESLRDYVNNWERTKSEMLSMDVIQEKGDEYILNERYFVNYVGKLIYDLTKDTENQSDLEFDDYFAKLFEPYSGFDKKEECLAHAVFWGIIDQKEHNNTIRRLLEKWIFSQQFASWNEIAIYIPGIQKAIFDIINNRNFLPLDIERGFKWLLSIIADCSQDNPDNMVVKNINKWLETACATPHYNKKDDPLAITNGQGKIGPYNFYLKASDIIQDYSFALSILSLKPFKSCIQGLIAHAVLQESEYSPNSMELFQWVVSTSYNNILKKEIPLRLNSIIKSGLKEEYYTVIGLLNLTSYLGESVVGPTISLLPDYIDGNDIRSRKILAARKCWCTDSAELCRTYALSEKDDLSSQYATKVCVEMHDENVIDYIVEEIKKEKRQLYDYEIPQIWESKHKDWLSTFIKQDNLINKVKSEYNSLKFPCSFRPSEYVMDYISGFLSGKTSDKIFHALFSKSSWGNGKLGTISESFLSNEIAKCLLELKKGKIHEFRGHTMLDSNWESISPLLYHNAPLMAVEFVQSQIRKLEEYNNPDVFTWILCEGGATVASTDEYRILSEMYNKKLKEPLTAENIKWYKIDLLKSLMMSSPDLSVAQDILINSPYSITKWTGIDPARLPLVDVDFINKVFDIIKQSDEKSLLGYMWMVFHAGYCNKQKACEIGRKYFFDSNDDIRYVASAILGCYGKDEEAKFLWDNIELIQKTVANRQHYFAAVFWKYNNILKNIPIKQLLNVFSLYLVNHLLYVWDDENRAEEFADAIDNHIENLLKKKQKGIREFFIPYYTSEGLEYLWKYCPTRVHKWVDEALNAKHYDSFSMSSFYWEIAAFLLNKEPETSIKIAKILSRFSSSGDWKIKICSKDVPEIIKNYREKCIFDSNRNSEIFEWALSFRDASNNDWGWAIKYLKDENPIKRAIAVQILGWSGHTCEEEINKLCYGDNNYYVRCSARKADEDWWREHWARKWYQELFCTKTIEDTWAAQELFKFVVDERAEVWFSPTKEMMESRNWKQKSIIFNTQYKLKDYSKNYSDAQKENVFGQKISNFKHVLENFRCPALKL